MACDCRPSPIQAGHAAEASTETETFELGALLVSDTGRAPHDYMGHMTGGDPATASDAIEKTRQFLGEQLMR